MLHLVGERDEEDVLFGGRGGEEVVPFVTSPVNLTHSFRLIKVLNRNPSCRFLPELWASDYKMFRIPI